MKMYKKILSAFLAVLTFVGVFAQVNLVSAADTAVKTGNYIFVNVATGECLTLENNSDSDGAKFTLTSKDGGVDQVMKIKVKSSLYRIQPAQSTTRFLTADTSSTDMQTSLVLSNDSAEQNWTFAVTLTGEYIIKSAADPTLVLTATDLGAVVQAYSEGDATQRWKLEPFTLGKSGDTQGVYAYGIDVSTHNGDINWQAVKEYGIDFAIIRLGYGQDFEDQDDAKFKANADACKALGIPFGVYLYSYADSTAKAKSEAQHCLRLVKDYDLSLPIYYDLEDAKTTGACSSAKILEISKAFATAITSAGYEVGFYSNTYWWTNKLTDSYYDGFSRWVAQYNSVCTYTGKKDIWQYTSSGKVAGIEKSVDMNALYYPLIQYTYSGNALHPTFTVYGSDGETLVNGRDYTITWRDNINAGTAYADIVGINDYVGFTDTKRFTITRRSLSSVVFSTVSDKTYTGKAVEQNLTLTYNGKKLVKDKDFTVTYKNNTKVGKATVTVTGIGNFTGTKKFTFNITKLKVKNAVITGLVDKAYNGKKRGNIGLKTSAGVKLVKDKDFTVTYKNNKDIGTATVTIKGIGDNCTGTYKTTFNIIPNTPKKLKASDISMKKATLSWKKSDEGTTYQLYRATSPDGKYTLVYSGKETSYKETSLKNGTYYFYKVRAVKKVDGKKYYSEYSSVLKMHTELKTTDFSLKRNYSKRTTKVKIEKTSGVTGYVVYQYKGSKKAYVKVYEGTKVEYVIKNCKKGTTYRFKIQTYKDTKYGRIYSPISEMQSVVYKK